MGGRRWEGRRAGGVLTSFQHALSPSDMQGCPATRRTPPTCSALSTRFSVGLVCAAAAGRATGGRPAVSVVAATRAAACCTPESPRAWSARRRVCMPRCAAGSVCALPACRTGAACTSAARRTKEGGALGKACQAGDGARLCAHGTRASTARVSGKAHLLPRWPLQRGPPSGLPARPPGRAEAARAAPRPCAALRSAPPGCAAPERAPAPPLAPRLLLLELRLALPPCRPPPRPRHQPPPPRSGETAPAGP